MVLVNAVYFKGNWKDQYDQKLTKPENFHVDKNNIIQVPTMYMKKKIFHGYFENLKAQYVGLPYQVSYLHFKIDLR